MWLSAPLMNLFWLYSFTPPDLNLGIKSRLAGCLLSKYNQPMNTVTCPCQACYNSRNLLIVLKRVIGMWSKQMEDGRRKKKKKDGKRYAKTRMTSSLREEKEDWMREARAKSCIKKACITKSMAKKTKQKSPEELS